MSLQSVLHVLPTFVAVVRAGGVRKATETLALTHGAISQQIQLLESALGQTLFTRHRQRVQVNAAGQALYHLAVKMIEEIEVWEERARRQKQIEPVRYD